MKIFELIFWLSLTSAIPGILYVIRLPQIGTSYLIIFLYSVIATMVEIANHYLKLSSPILGNVFVLFEAVLFYILITKWQFPNLYTRKCLILPLIFVLWMSTTLYTGVYERNVIFRILYSLLLVIGSINVINHLLFENKPLYRDFRFIICISLLLFYTFNIIVETFCLTDIEFSVNFTINLFFVKVAFNILGNLLFALAILCIPKKPRYILPYC